MTRHKVGAKVKATRDQAPHPGHRQGQEGRVTSVHEGLFYGVSFGGSNVFLPAGHVNDPDNDNDVDQPGQQDVDVPSGSDGPSPASDRFRGLMDFLHDHGK